MSLIDPGLFSVMKLFPSEKKWLRQMYLNSRSFRTLCSDYRRCESVLAYWRDAEHEDAPEICQEYDELKHGLEAEIRDLLCSAHLRSESVSSNRPRIKRGA